MMHKQHFYTIVTQWSGNLGEGTKDYRAYSRNHTISAFNKPIIAASSDPAFLGDASLYNPEELLVASLSACHMLWYLHLCSQAGVVVIAYHDDATGIMEETADGSGRFTEVVLHPIVTIADTSMRAQASFLHHEAHRLCFIANSVNFEVRCEGKFFVVSS